MLKALAPVKEGRGLLLGLRPIPLILFRPCLNVIFLRPASISEEKDT